MPYRIHSNDAEVEGFEPRYAVRITVFETAPFNHSGTPPEKTVY